MAIIKPFKGLRPVRDKASAVASPPYDVLNSDEARQMAKGNPDCFLRVVKPEIDLPEDTDPHADIVYQTARENLARLVDTGRMKRDNAPCLYLYRQVMPLEGGEHSQIGLVAGASVEEYQKGLIKKHEFTRVTKEKDRTRHVKECNAHTGPVFLTYVATDRVNAIVTRLSAGTPEYDFTAPDGISHTFWVVAGEADIQELTDAFVEIPHMYIADGHHRSASASTYGAERKEANPSHTGDEPYNTFLTVIFPHNQMMILDYNRVVFDLNGLTPAALIEKASEKFTVTPTDTAKPTRGQTFGMYLDGKWYSLEAKEGTFDANDPVNRLDVAILQNNLLAPVLGIGDPRTDERIDFVGGIRGMKELERRVKEGAAVAFSLFPTPIEQLMAIADADEVMPPKSTWFEPKLRSGLVVKPLD